MADLTITVAGRTFRPAEPPTLWQVKYMGQQVRAAGLTTITPPRGDDGELDGVAFLAVIAERLLDAPVKVQTRILAAMLTEDGRAWDQDDAERNAVLFGTATDVDSQTALEDAAIGLVLRFFGSRARSTATSAPASPGEPRTISADAAPTSATASTSASTDRSPGNWPTARPTALPV